MEKEKSENNNSSRNSIIILLLIIIISILLYNNGTLYKFKKITKDNLNEILTTNKLTTEEKQSITIKYIFNQNSVLNKTIYEVLK